MPVTTRFLSNASLEWEAPEKNMSRYVYVLHEGKVLCHEEDGQKDPPPEFSRHRQILCHLSGQWQLRNTAVWELWDGQGVILLLDSAGKSRSLLKSEPYDEKSLIGDALRVIDYGGWAEYDEHQRVEGIIAQRRESIIKPFREDRDRWRNQADHFKDELEKLLETVGKMKDAIAAAYDITSKGGPDSRKKAKELLLPFVGVCVTCQHAVCICGKEKKQTT